MNIETDTEAARQRMFEKITLENELVLGYPSIESVEIEMSLISGPGELAEILMHHPEGSSIVWGAWPGRSDDGFNAITMNLVDADGVLRAHPH